MPGATRRALGGGSGSTRETGRVDLSSLLTHERRRPADSRLVKSNLQEPEVGDVEERRLAERRADVGHVRDLAAAGADDRLSGMPAGLG